MGVQGKIPWGEIMRLGIMHRIILGAVAPLVLVTATASGSSAYSGTGTRAAVEGRRIVHGVTGGDLLEWSTDPEPYYLVRPGGDFGWVYRGDGDPGSAGPAIDIRWRSCADPTVYGLTHLHITPGKDIVLVGKDLPVFSCVLLQWRPWALADTHRPFLGVTHWNQDWSR